MNPILDLSFEKNEDDLFNNSMLDWDATKKGDFSTLFVVVYHVTIVAIGHGLLNNCWPMVIGVLRPEESSII